MTDPQAAVERAPKLASDLRQFANVGSSLDLPTPKRTAREAADALDALAAALARKQQAYELAIRSSHPTEVAEAIIASVRDALAASTAGQKPR